MIILDHEQGTPEWAGSRLGRPSASQFSNLITVKGKPSSSAAKYILKLISERITGESEQFFQSSAMLRGIEMESDAREAYEYITGNQVQEYGFILDDSGEYGCSPDGMLVDENVGLELKCPLAPNHTKYLLNPNELVKDYFQQVQGCLLVTEREAWDIFSYHPLAGHVLVRVPRDEEFITKLKAELDTAIDIILTETEKLA